MNRPTTTLGWVGAGLAVALVGTFGAWLKYKQPHLLSVWKPFILTQHQFDYELEFVKRGFVGELFRWAGVARTTQAVSVFSWLVLAGVAALLVRLARTCTRQVGSAGELPTVWLASVVVSPATFLQAGGDLGRLDPMLLACQLGLLLVAPLAGLRWTMVAIALTGVGVATHELFLLAHLPLACAVHVYLGWHRPSQRRELWIRGGAILASGAVGAACVAGWGRMDGLAMDSYMAFLQQHRGLGHPNLEGVAVLYNTLGENIAYAWRQLAAKSPWGIPCAAAVTGAYFWLCLRSTGTKRANVLLLGIAAVTPLLLLLLAYDYGRWFSFSTTNILLAALVCQQASTERIDWRPLRWTWLFTIMGPYGVTVGFPWWAA